MNAFTFGAESQEITRALRADSTQAAPKAGRSGCGFTQDDKREVMHVIDGGGGEMEREIEMGGGEI